MKLFGKTLLLVLVATLGACGKTQVSFKENCNLNDGLYESNDGNEALQILVDGESADLYIGNEVEPMDVETCSVSTEIGTASIRIMGVDTFSLVGDGGSFQFHRIGNGWDDEF